MKKTVTIITLCFGLYACGPNTGQGGTTDDGFKGGGDQNGAMSDSAGFQPNPSLDTSIGDQRVDTEQRDSTKREQ